MHLYMHANLSNLFPQRPRQFIPSHPFHSLTTFLPPSTFSTTHCPQLRPQHPWLNTHRLAHLIRTRLQIEQELIPSHPAAEALSTLTQLQQFCKKAPRSSSCGSSSYTACHATLVPSLFCRAGSRRPGRRQRTPTMLRSRQVRCRTGQHLCRYRPIA